MPWRQGLEGCRVDPCLRILQIFPLADGKTTGRAAILRAIMDASRHDHCAGGKRCYDRAGETMTILKRRDVLMTAAAAALLPRSIARAQDAWPQRTITIVVPFLAGGSADLVARIFAQHFQAKF